MRIESLQDWSTYLNRVGMTSLGPGRPWEGMSDRDRAKWAHTFKDGAGQRREVDGYLLARLVGIPFPSGPRSGSADVRAWASVADPSLWQSSGGDGPFAPEMRDTSLEVWTECELCILHARAWAELNSGGLSPRLRAAAKWLVAEIQPDNATTRPWGVGVFALMAVRDRDPDAAMYAETLVHNTLVSGSGRPEPMSACILLDAADWLAAAARE